MILELLKYILGGLLGFFILGLIGVAYVMWNIFVRKLRALQRCGGMSHYHIKRKFWLIEIWDTLHGDGK